jgi:hypothetical protein
MADLRNFNSRISLIEHYDKLGEIYDLLQKESEKKITQQFVIDTIINKAYEKIIKEQNKKEKKKKKKKAVAT